ncbi:MAG: hypothetical protein Kapaf2KO_17070 [Candidatus Kapaibacteriales bacterium]
MQYVRNISSAFTILTLCFCLSFSQDRFNSSDTDLGFKSKTTYSKESNTVDIELWLDLSKKEDGDVYSLFRNGDFGYRTIQSNITDLPVVDIGLDANEVYEYKLEKRTTRKFRNQGQELTIGMLFNNYVAAGKIDKFPHSGKTQLLVIDETLSDSLEVELEAYSQALIQNGWGVRTIEVPRTENFDTEKVEETHQAIVEAIELEQSINSIFLIGRVPVPYSGNLNPDAHGDHIGAWPFDAYYASRTKRTMSDNIVNNTTARREANHNVAGDGKYDNSNGVQVDMPIGRIDFYDMPEFSESEIELLKGYLERATAWHLGETEFEYSAVIDDNFSAYNYPEAFASTGYRAGSQFIESENRINNVDLREAHTNGTPLFSYGCGAGGYSSCNGVGTTKNFAEGDFSGVFGFLFGSYFGDWDSRNNILRATVASGAMLSCGWAGRPHWFTFMMNTGESIGEAFKFSYNNVGSFQSHAVVSGGTQFINNSMNGVHISLMGDPALNAYPIKLGNIEITDVMLDSAEPTDAITITPISSNPYQGYDVYYSYTPEGPFEKLNDNLIEEELTLPFHYTGEVTFALYGVDIINGFGVERPEYTFLGKQTKEMKTTISVENALSSNDRIWTTGDLINIELEQANKSNLDIYSSSGRLIATKELDLRNGLSQFQVSELFDLTSQANGIYLIKLNSQNITLTTKIFID